MTSTTTQVPPHADPQLGRRPERDRDSLLELLAVIDREGWDAATGTQLLKYVRTHLVHPLTIDVGLRGAMASQAEASAWEAAWIALTKPSLRSARSPWGVLWQTARRAVLNEIAAAQFATNPRRAWRLADDAGHGSVLPPVSLETLLESGRQLPDDAPADPANLIVAEALAQACAALVGVGWDSDLAARIVVAVLDVDDIPSDPRSTALGWRLLASSLGIPAWQARRLTVVLRGTADWDGLLARLLREGTEVVGDAGMRGALIATRHRSHRSPVLAAERATALQGHPRRAAS